MVKTHQKNPKYNIILEQTMRVSPDQIEILSETKTRTGHPKIIFKSRLQEHSKTNKNGRSYSQVVCENIVSQLSPKARSRGMFMEVDHPMFFSGSNDPELMKRRAGIIELKNCGAVCRNISMNDRYIVGEIETLSGFRGPDLANIIENDKVDLGFSLRALGGVKKLDSGVLEVQSNIFPITYDIVSNPSHENAKIMEFLPETDCSLLENANTILFEGCELELLEEDNIEISESKGINKFVNDILKENFRRVIKDIKFII